MFESTRTLARKYFDEARGREGFSDPHASELFERLEQLDFLNERITECCRVQAEQASSPEAYGNFFQARLYVEAFYYFAWRIVSFTREGWLPGLKFEAPGVRNARHNLVEHSEGKDSGAIHQHFAFDPERGIILKIGRAPGQSPNRVEDHGSTANIAEFKANLEAALAKGKR